MKKMMNNVTMVTIDDTMNNNIWSCLHRCGSAELCPRLLVSRSNRGRASSSWRPARQPALCYHGDREQRYWWRGEYCVSLKWTNKLWLVLKQNICTWIFNLGFGPGSDPTPCFWLLSLNFNQTFGLLWHSPDFIALTLVLVWDGARLSGCILLYSLEPAMTESG